MIASAAVAVGPKDHPNRRSPVDLLDGPRQLTRGRIRVINFAISRKEPHPMGPARRRVRSNNIVVQHASNGIALLLEPLEKTRSSQQALFLPGDRSKQ